MSKLLRSSILVAVFAVTTALAATGFGAIKIDISTTDLIFGEVQVGTTVERTFTITNEASSTGNAFIQLSPPTSGYYTIVGGWDPFTLVPGQTTTITISFKPTCTCILDDAITITDNGDGTTSSNPTIVDLTGQGSIGTGGGGDTTLKIGFNNYFSTQNTINFGSIAVGTTATVTFTVDNASSGSTERSLTGSISGVTSPFIETVGQGSFILPSGGSHTITLIFGPAAAGSFLDSLVVLSNADDPNSRRIVIYLTGSGTQAQPSTDTSLVIGFNGTIPNSDYLDFGKITVGTFGTVTFVVDDASSSNTMRQLIGLVGNADAPFSVASGSGVFILNSGGMHVVTINFTPKANGTFDDSVVITSNADNGHNITLHLHGIGIGASSGGGGDSIAMLGVSGLTQVLNFGDIGVGNVGYLYFTLTNISNTNTTVAGQLTQTASPFSVLTGNTFSLTEGNSTSVFVSFKPTHTGEFFDSIVVTSNAAAPNNRLVVYVLGSSGVAGVTNVTATGTSLSTYPNPFATTNTLEVSLAKTADVNVGVYDLLGREVAHLANGSFSAGTHALAWNATGFRNGTYFYRVQVGSETRTLPVVISR
jgi:hypothetical protein